MQFPNGEKQAIVLSSYKIHKPQQNPAQQAIPKGSIVAFISWN